MWCLAAVKIGGAPEAALFLKIGKVFLFSGGAVPAFKEWKGAVPAGVVASVADVAMVRA